MFGKMFQCCCCGDGPGDRHRFPEAACFAFSVFAPQQRIRNCDLSNADGGVGSSSSLPAHHLGPVGEVVLQQPKAGNCLVCISIQRFREGDRADREGGGGGGETTSQWDTG